MTTREELLEQVTVDLSKGGGQARIRGTRIDINIVLDSLAEGLTAAQVIEEYPALCVDDVRAAIAYAAELARDEFIVLRRP